MRTATQKGNFIQRLASLLPQLLGCEVWKTHVHGSIRRFPVTNWVARDILTLLLLFTHISIYYLNYK